ncbi:MAG: hypothetical protein LBT01_01135 [Spirochaetaceae bacterium]|jgi:23S rRNA maturation mini-RNase III|nr:hypothetical protein [Spirochaetaceae bacterium]
MAITPLDLQTLFSQIENIGKELAVQKEGSALHALMQNDVQQKINAEKQKSVLEADDSGEGPDKLKDKQQRGGNNANNKKFTGNNNDENHQSAQAMRAVHDPNLGQYVDISG